VIVLVSVETVATLARRGPVEASDDAVTDWSAITTPSIVALAPIVAEDPTFHQTFTCSVDVAWFVICTRAPPATVRVVPIWKIHAAKGSPPAFKMSVPVRVNPAATL
jgi:hypothetical protein